MLDRTTNIPTKSEYQQANVTPLPTDDEKLLLKTFKLALTVYKDLVLSVSINTKAVRIAFDLVDGCSTTANPDGDVALTWNRLIQNTSQKQLHCTSN